MNNKGTVENNIKNKKNDCCSLIFHRRMFVLTRKGYIKCWDFFKVTLLFSPCLQAFYVHLCMYVCNDVFIYVMIHIDCLLHPALTSLPFPFATILDQSNHLCVSNEYHIFTASYGFYYYILFSFSFFCYPHLF